jgi:hypothetical protein
MIIFALSIAAKQHLSTAISAVIHKPAIDAISVVLECSAAGTRSQPLRFRHPEGARR